MIQSNLYGTVSTIKQCNSEFNCFVECPVRVVSNDEIHHQISCSLFVQQTLDEHRRPHTMQTTHDANATHQQQSQPDNVHNAVNSSKATNIYRNEH